MATPDLTKSGLTAAAELKKSAAEVVALSTKWRKIRVDQQNASQKIYDQGSKAKNGAELKKAQVLGDKLEVLMHKNRDLALADHTKWLKAWKDASEMLRELPDRIGDLRKTQGRYQLVIDKAVVGLKAALKKQGQERQKAILDALKASGLM